jgi:hypothetical protein
MFDNINKPEPNEIKIWLNEVKLTINQASIALGISKRQFSRFLSGDTKAKKVHALAMQMVWLVEEKNKDLIEERKIFPKKEIIKIQIK